MTTTRTTNERPLSPGEMRAVGVVNDAASAAWQTQTTIAVVLVRLNGEYHGAFISAYGPNERSPSLSGESVRVAVDLSTAAEIKAAIINGQPVPEEVVIQTANEEGGAE